MLATVPCCLADSCPDEEVLTAQDSPREDTGNNTDCDLCSPFFRCHNCNGFAYPHTIAKLVSLFVPEIKMYPVYSQNFLSRFTPAIWQPPKLA